MPPRESSLILREAYRDAAGRLAADPYLAEHASRDAAHLLLHTLGLPGTALHAHPGRPLSPAESRAFAAAISRRLRHEPVQYITGEQEFYGLSLRVTPATLIPRPETELLVESVLAKLPAEARVADVGTGSGAIAVALAHHLPGAAVVALDLSAAALLVAEENARRHSVAERISFRASDLLAALNPGDRIDAIVSNPPYVPAAEASSLHPQVRDYEPALALYAEDDGLAVYRRLIPQAFVSLPPGGLLAMEIGHGQRAALTELLQEWREVEFRDDLNGIPRVVLARRP